MHYQYNYLPKTTIMKKLTLVFTVVLAMGVLFTSCKKDKTNTELLTISKGWVLSAATSSPAYALSDTSFATNLMTDGYLLECELDDVIKFSENGAQTIVPNDVCVDGYQLETAALWSFLEEETILKMQLPFFYNDDWTSYDAEFEECKILSLTEDELRIKFTFNDDETPAKGTYSFTLTYVPAN